MEDNNETVCFFSEWIYALAHDAFAQVDKSVAGSQVHRWTLPWFLTYESNERICKKHFKKLFNMLYQNKI